MLLAVMFSLFADLRAVLSQDMVCI